MSIVKVMPQKILALEYRQEESDKDYGTCMWARFYLDRINYTLLIESDCGTYGYSWTPTPRSESFIKLMTRIDGEYLLSKISSRSEVDSEMTIENIKGIIAREYGEDFDKVIVNGEIEEYEIDQIELACYFERYQSVGESLVSVLKEIDGIDLDDYEIWRAIETDYPADAKKIASIFVEEIEPRLKVILKLRGSRNDR